MKTLIIIRRLLFVIAGAFSIFMAVEIDDLPIGDLVMSKEYGGEAYSGIQQAGATTATNLVELSKIAKDGLSGILYVAGFVCLACAVPVGIGRSKKEE